MRRGGNVTLETFVLRNLEKLRNQEKLHRGGGIFRYSQTERQNPGWRNCQTRASVTCEDSEEWPRLLPRTQVKRR